MQPRTAVKPAPDEAIAFLKSIGGSPDPFGRSYGRAAGSPAPTLTAIRARFRPSQRCCRSPGPIISTSPADNTVYNRGPVMNLIDSPSYPSGHTTFGYMGSILLAVLTPDRYQQMIARGAEYGNDRILLGSHYAMDVLAGRTLATYDLAHLLANDPNYMGRPLRDVAATTGMSEPRVPAAITDFQAALKKAKAELTAALEASCGDKVEVCAAQDIGRFSMPAMNQTFYDATQTYGLPVVYPDMEGKVEDVGKMAPEAGYLLTAAFPSLTLEQANQILTETEGPGGGFLDDGSAFGLYSRLNLYAAAGRAKTFAPTR